MDELETVVTRWREVGFDATVVTDPRATIRAPLDTDSPMAPLVPIASAALTPLPAFSLETGLPHISVDLPSTFTSGQEADDKARGARPELEIQGLLGEGGMGRVFVARQRSLDREVAIKTLRDRASPNDRRALVAEGAVTGYLEHPSIIPVHALGVHADGRPVLVMKRVDGVSWHDLLRDSSHPAWEGWAGTPGDRLPGHLEILMHVCNAAHYAHSRGIVHLDIKPQNVLIGRFGDVYLADFGIAHRIVAAATARICGTPAYMAPEMATGDEVDARTDVYLLGATLHEVLTGKSRHVGDHIAAVMFDAVTSPAFAYAATVPTDLAALANRSTAKDRDERPKTAALFRTALADHLRHKTSRALVKSATDRIAKLRAPLGGDGGERDVHDARDESRETELLLAEARFALAQAFEQWPENPEAKKAEVALEAHLSARRARSAELEKIARLLDPRVAARQRIYAIGGMAIVTSAMLANALGQGLRHIPEPRWLFRASFLPCIVVIPLTLAFRRQLSASTINKQAAFLLWAGSYSICISRALDLRAGTAGPAMLVHDSMIAAALAAFAAATLPRWVWASFAFFVTSAVVGTLDPALAHVAFNVAVGGALMLGVLFAREKMRS